MPEGLDRDMKRQSARAASRRNTWRKIKVVLRDVLSRRWFLSGGLITLPQSIK